MLLQFEFVTAGVVTRHIQLKEIGEVNILFPCNQLICFNQVSSKSPLLKYVPLPVVALDSKPFSDRLG